MKKTTLSEPTMPTQNIHFKRLQWANKALFIEIVSLSYVILFLYTGLNKIVDLPINKILLAQSPVISPIAPAVAWGVPIAEFIVAIAVFFPRLRLKGLYAAFSLMTIFTAYIIIMLTTSDQLPCSCGGIIQQLSWPQHIVFNVIFMILAGVAIQLLRKQTKTY